MNCSLIISSQANNKQTWGREEGEDKRDQNPLLSLSHAQRPPPFNIVIYPQLLLLLLLLLMLLLLVIVVVEKTYCHNHFSLLAAPTFTHTHNTHHTQTHAHKHNTHTLRIVEQNCLDWSVITTSIIVGYILFCPKTIIDHLICFCLM